MKELCEKILGDGEVCGLPREGHMNFCTFHSSVPISNTNKNLLRRFAEETKTRATLELSNISFRGCTFDRDFGELLKEIDKPVSFNSSRFNLCKFREFKFPKCVYFYDCNFEKSNFRLVNFLGDAVDFTLARFSGQLSPFDYCTLEPKKGIDFRDASFRLTASPFKETFMRSEKISFMNAHIESERFFIRYSKDSGPSRSPRGLTLHVQGLLDNKLSPGLIWFTGLKFDGHFEYANDQNSADENPPVILFAWVNFSQMKSATFIRANLHKACFAYSVTQDVRFIGVDWPEEDDRRILYDEQVKPEGATLDDLRWEYAQLKKNYSSNQDYVRAGQWYFRETECRRKMAGENIGNRRWANGNSRMGRAIFSLYRWTSEYGENHIRAFMWLVALWLGFACVYLHTGFSLDGSTIEYDFEWPPSYVSVWDVLDAMRFSFFAMAFQIGKAAELVGRASSTAYAIHLGLTAIMLPLFLFALRRKFKQ